MAETTNAVVVYFPTTIPRYRGQTIRSNVRNWRKTHVKVKATVRAVDPMYLPRGSK